MASNKHQHRQQCFFKTANNPQEHKTTSGIWEFVNIIVVGSRITPTTQQSTIHYGMIKTNLKNIKTNQKQTSTHKTNEAQAQTPKQRKHKHTIQPNHHTKTNKYTNIQYNQTNKLFRRFYLSSTQTHTVQTHIPLLGKQSSSQNTITITK